MIRQRLLLDTYYYTYKFIDIKKKLLYYFACIFESNGNR